MKVSVITVCLNNVGTLPDTIESVSKQTYHDIEHIIIDGGSTDGTLDVLEHYKERLDVVVSERDRGWFDAMNKGVARATGDCIGFLNADDFYASADSLSKIVNALEEPDVDAVYGFVDIVDRADTSRVRRRYRVSHATKWFFRVGMMPAHPTFYAKRELFDRCGGFLNDSCVPPDFELMVRFLTQGGMRSKLIPEVLVKMRNEGMSNASIKTRINRIQRQVTSCRINGLWTHPLLVITKYPYKIVEYMRKS